jgi:hypothetical protein
MTQRDIVRGAGSAVIHLGAIVTGFILMIVGLAMGVTLVMLPVGIAVGFVGLFLVLWGMFGRAEGAAESGGKSIFED